MKLTGQTAGSSGDCRTVTGIPKRFWCLSCRSLRLPELQIRTLWNGVGIAADSPCRSSLILQRDVSFCISAQWTMRGKCGSTEVTQAVIAADIHRQSLTSPNICKAVKTVLILLWRTRYAPHCSLPENSVSNTVRTLAFILAARESGRRCGWNMYQKYIFKKSKCCRT